MDLVGWVSKAQLTFERTVSLVICASLAHPTQSRVTHFRIIAEGGGLAFDRRLCRRNVFVWKLKETRDEWLRNTEEEKDRGKEDTEVEARA